MRTSESITHLAAALTIAQSQYPAIPRDKTVKIRTKAGGEYTFQYAPLDSILSALRPVLAANGLSVLQDIEGGAVSTMILHASGEWWYGATVLVPPEEPGAKPVGSALTYAQRYSLRAALNVATDDDDDATTASGDHMAVKAPERPQNASSPSADTRHAPDVNAAPSDGKSVNSSVKDKEPFVLVGSMYSPASLAVVKTKKGEVDTADFIFQHGEGGTKIQAKAWGHAGEAALSLAAGTPIEIRGTWHVWQDKASLSVNELSVMQAPEGPANPEYADDEIPF